MLAATESPRPGVGWERGGSDVDMVGKSFDGGSLTRIIGTGSGMVVEGDAGERVETAETHA